jgi:PAS domain S-box-containing protein
MVLNLVQNAVLLLGMLTLYSLTAPLRSRSNFWSKVFLGALFGGIAIIGMRIPFNYTPGIFYDGRSIVLSLSGAFGGGITALVSMVIAGVFRTIVGGNGIWAGLATILTSGLLGIAFNHYYRARDKRIQIGHLYIFGVIVHIFMLTCQLLVQPWPAGITIIKQIWLPILVVFPVATVLIGILLRTEDGRLKTQQDLKVTTERYQNLVNKSQDMIFRLQIKPDLRFEFVNPYCVTMTGYTPEEFYQHPELGFSMIHPDDQSIFFGGENGTALFEKPSTFRWICKDGQTIWVEMRNTPFFDAKGNLGAIEGIVRDVTESKKFEQSILDYNQRLESEVQERTRELQSAQQSMLKHERMVTMGRLAAGVAHELRNPLGVISNSVYFLKMIQPGAEAKVKEYLGILEKEARIAVELMTDMVNFSNLQAGDRQPTKVSELIDRVFSDNPVPAEIVVVKKISKYAPDVFVDPHQMSQALHRVVDNAVEAMEYKGKIKITVEKPGKPDQGFLRIDVKDEGPGIAPENLDQLYEPLFSTKPRHIGLGLPIAKRLIEVNGGRIDVQSVWGKGTTFVIFLPMNPEA